MLFSVYMPKLFAAVSVGTGIKIGMEVDHPHPIGIPIQDPIRIITVEETLAAEALQEAAVPAEVFNKIKKGEYKNGEHFTDYF